LFLPLFLFSWGGGEGEVDGVEGESRVRPLGEASFGIAVSGVVECTMRGESGGLVVVRP
jgi:hypothetical protein